MKIEHKSGSENAPCIQPKDLSELKLVLQVSKTKFVTVQVNRDWSANIEIPLDLPDCLVTRGRLEGADGTATAGQLWDLPSIDGESRLRRTDLDRAADHLDRDGRDGLAPAFGALALALRQLRIEPQLPSELHSPTVGDELRARYDDVERRFREELRGFLRR